MKESIFIITHIFPPEIHGSGIMNRQLAEDLAALGCTVKVITCFPSHPEGMLHPGWRRSIVRRTREKGYEIIRSWHPVSSINSLLARALITAGQSLSYGMSTLFSGKPDIVISDGPPLMGALVSAVIAGIYKARFIIVVHDFVIDILAETNQNQTGVLNILRKFESWLYQLADKVVVLSEGFKKTLIRDKEVEPERVAIIPVWLDCRDISPMDRDNPWRREMGIGPEKFVVLYAGTIGLVSGAEMVVAAAKKLEEHPNILFLFVGTGSKKKNLEDMVLEARLKNVRFLPFQPRERLSELQATGDVSLVTLAPGRGKTSVPSKILGYMAASRPVIAAVDRDSDTAALVRKAKCGMVVSPNQSEEIAAAILDVLHQPLKGESMGKAGYTFFLKNFERKKVVRDYISVISS
jgi:colanic acid biosynthesis glycosyl transferase WcaI